MQRTPVLLLCLSFVACNDEPLPDGSWDVTVVGDTTNCTTDTSGYQDSFRYDLYYSGYIVDLYVDDIYFATGGVTGCSLQYQSSTWLEERGDGSWLRWSLEGEAVIQGKAGGCDIDNDLDWAGTELITVEESSDEDDGLTGCTYLLNVTGTYVEPE